MKNKLKNVAIRIKNKIQEMYWFFIIVSLLLLAFNLDYVLGRPWNNHYVLIWQWKHFRVLRIMPRNVVILIDGHKIYRYFNNKSKETYIRAIQMDNRLEVDILHYKYLLDWVINPPVLKAYPTNLKTDVEILNYVNQKL